MAASAELEKIGLPLLVLVLLLLFVCLHAMSAETTDRNFRRDHIGYAVFSFVFFGILVLRTHISGGRVDILDVVIKTMAFIVLLWVLLWISGAKKVEKEDYIDETVRLNTNSVPLYSARSCSCSHNSPRICNCNNNNNNNNLRNSGSPNRTSGNRSNNSNPTNNAQINYNFQPTNHLMGPHTIRSTAATSTHSHSHVPRYQQQQVFLSRHELFLSSEMVSRISPRTPPPAYSSLETLSSEPPPPYDECMCK